MAEIKICLVVPDGEGMGQARLEMFDELTRVVEKYGSHISELSGASATGDPLPEEITGEEPAIARAATDVPVDAAANKRIFDWEELPDEL